MTKFMERMPTAKQKMKIEDIIPYSKNAKAVKL